MLILALADLIREGGNRHAHSGLEKTTDAETARMMTELMDDMIEYLFVLPHRVEELQKAIHRLDAGPVEHPEEHP